MNNSCCGNQAIDGWQPVGSHSTQSHRLVRDFFIDRQDF